jgi:DNA processing protein
VPGDVDRETARGCHALLRGGAALCEQAADVLAAIGRTGVAAPAAAQAAGTPAPGGGGSEGTSSAPRATPEARMLAALEPAPRTVDTLAARAGLTVPEALSALLRLQWSGAATAWPGQRWTRGQA